MYEKFFGLRERPFDLTPNPRFMYFTPRHREALVNLQFGIESRKGVVVLIGEAGMGKTTVIRAAIETQRNNKVRCVYLNNPLLTRGEFIEFLANALQLSTAAERSKTRLVAELASRLTEERQRGATVVLLIDEAQSLSDELLEELRMLTNIETNSEKLVTLVLVGQPQLADRLNDERLGQLKQRVELRCTLSPFDLAETVMYIRNRVRIAGGDAVQMFTRDAIQVIHERSRGIPRSISVICENALVGAFAENQKPVTRALVQEVCDELDLSPETPEDGKPGRGGDRPLSPALPNTRHGNDKCRAGSEADPTVHAMATAADTATVLLPYPSRPGDAGGHSRWQGGDREPARSCIEATGSRVNRISLQPDAPTSESTHDGDSHVNPVGLIDHFPLEPGQSEIVRLPLKAPVTEPRWRPAPPALAPEAGGSQSHRRASARRLPARLSAASRWIRGRPSSIDVSQRLCIRRRSSAASRK